MSVQKWLYGSWPASYMAVYGTTFTGYTVKVSQNGTYTFYGRDYVGNETVSTVTVSYVSSPITVTHPVSIAYSINPNSSTPFTAQDIPITNQSLVKITVSVQSFAPATGGTLTMTNASPTKYADWTKLTASQTKTDIALSLCVKETSTGSGTWASINQSSPLYAANITGKTLLGTLNGSGAAGNLKLSALCGLAWDAAYTSKHNLVLVFDAL